MGAGDLLLLHTDGLSEHSDDQYFLTRVEERLRQVKVLTTQEIYKAGAIILSANAWFAQWGYWPDNNSLVIGTRNKGQRLNNDRGEGWDHVVLTVADKGNEIVSIYLNGRLVTKGGSDSQLRKILNEDLLLGNHPTTSTRWSQHLGNTWPITHYLLKTDPNIASRYEDDLKSIRYRLVCKVVSFLASIMV